MPRWRSALMAIFAVGAPAVSAQGPDILMFGTTHEPNSVIYRYAVDYLQQLCAEVHQRCELKSLPGRRSSAMMASGSLAGEVGRVYTYNNQYPQYSRIEEPFVSTRTYAFTRQGRPTINSWQELAQTARTVSYKRGIYFYQTKLESMRPAIQPHDVQSVPACVEVVLAVRDDACVFDDGSLTPEARALLPQGRTGKQLDDLQLYIYLGKDYAVLADAFTAAARRLSARGVKTQLRQKYFG